MNEQALEALLGAVAQGDLPVGEALARLRHLPFEVVDTVAHLDHHRLLRQGYPEFVYAEGKHPEHVVELMVRLMVTNNAVLATRASPETTTAVQARLPQAEYDPTSRVLRAGGPLPLPADESLAIGVLSGGTSDLPVAEESAQVAEFLGHRVIRLYDVGVAGLHRLLHRASVLYETQVLIVVAGMDGVLPSVVGGLVGIPVIAVPTSVGYGTSFGGLAPLLTMLNTCAAGVTVVNIDNGFGAALAAHRIGRARHNGG
ncbi:MAG: nickel pincer cofactor biosynthesis protein LarB [Dehalococcoidia bacterium]